MNRTTCEIFSLAPIGGEGRGEGGTPGIVEVHGEGGYDDGFSTDKLPN